MLMQFPCHVFTHQPLQTVSQVWTYTPVCRSGSRWQPFCFVAAIFLFLLSLWWCMIRFICVGRGKKHCLNIDRLLTLLQGSVNDIWRRNGETEKVMCDILFSIWRSNRQPSEGVHYWCLCLHDDPLPLSACQAFGGGGGAAANIRLSVFCLYINLSHILYSRVCMCVRVNASGHLHIVHPPLPHHLPLSSGFI